MYVIHAQNIQPFLDMLMSGNPNPIYHLPEKLHRAWSTSTVPLLHWDSSLFLSS